ncbi:hypothetical protein AMS68_003663 [Peltaster fructicola]|uniref:Cupin type-2 domain-containing protein n=1 Tax=Peltaster fructicola TaxID=286661 RepID=A0A6H0XTZ5_9PEZI|nr:hypothetical protein AMS68_003663 [Peltaster fructicola]
MDELGEGSRDVRNTYLSGELRASFGHIGSSMSDLDIIFVTVVCTHTSILTASTFNQSRSSTPTMPSHEQKPVQVAEASSLKASGGQTGGMIRQNAFVDVADNICGLRMIAKPHSSSDVHHHGDQNTIIFAHSGVGIVVSEGGNKRVTLHPGDFAFIPAYAEHQEVNESDEDIVWSIVRSGGSPCTVNIDGWGKS